MALQWNAYCFVGDTLSDGRPVPPDGETLVYKGTPVLRASPTAWEALQYAYAPILCRVHCGGEIIRGDASLVCSDLTIVARIDATAVLRSFARSCARDVLHLWDAPQVVRDYLETGDETLRAAAREAAWDATDAEWAATNAEWAAARAAEWVAARAPTDAARAAACAAADASKAAQRARFNEMVDAAFMEAA
ncbi:MAG: hypothetical protein OEZ19_04720 [Paracoccaceae bacterium]|nr:hypothetical protein [Paracoccaceae bacterium]